MSKIFDSHAHYHDARFDEDRDELLSKLLSMGVGAVLTAAEDLDSSEFSIRLAERYDYIYAAAGIHPHCSDGLPGDYLDRLREYCRNSRVVAIGETGLDYYYDYSPRDVQKKVFTAQLELARELSLPIIIHDRDAHGDMMDILRKYRPRGVVHCFSGSAEMARELCSMGMYIGFTGNVTFKNAKKVLLAASAADIDLLLVETDCPYMAPEPFRGRRCDSSMIDISAAVLAGIRGISKEELLDITFRNAKKLYGV